MLSPVSQLWMLHSHLLIFSIYEKEVSVFVPAQRQTAFLRAHLKVKVITMQTLMFEEKVMTLPGPKAREILERDTYLVSQAYARA